MRTWVSLIAAGLALAYAHPASACPACAAGREARQRVAARDFTRNLLIVLAPFGLVGAASVCAERVGRRRKEGS